MIRVQFSGPGKVAGLVFLFLLASSVQSMELLENGGFESGVLSPWFTNQPDLPDDCGLSWNVSAIGGDDGTGCQPGVFGGTYPGAPFMGTYSAYNSFDGLAGTEYDLVQAVTLPPTVQEAVLSWVDTYNVDLTEGATELREFRIELRDITDGTVLEILHQRLIGVLDMQVEEDWTARQVDVTAVLAAYAGTELQIAFVNRVPEEFTGPGGFGLDEASLSVQQSPQIFSDGFEEHASP